MVIKDDPKSKPRSLPAAHAGPYMPLTTNDIEGAHTGWKPKHHMAGVPAERRRQYREINKLDDINGAQANTRRLAMSTKRHVNPLDPDYPLLDGSKHDVTHSTLQNTTNGDPFQAYASRLGFTGQGFLDSTSGRPPRTASTTASARLQAKDAEIARLKSELAAARHVTKPSRTLSC